MKTKIKINMVILVLALSFVSLAYASENLIPSSLGALRLLGTVLESDPTQSIAIIRDMNSKILNIYRAGDSLSEYRIIRISRGAIILLKDGKKISLDFPSGSEAEPVVAFAENEILLNRAALVKRMPGLNEALAQVLPVPHIVAGKIMGLKIAKIKDKELAAKAGIKEGDIIVSINDRKIENLQSALKVYQELSNEEKVNLQLKRGNEVKNLVYYLN